LIVLPTNSKVISFVALKSQKIGVQSGTTVDEAAQNLNGKNRALASNVSNPCRWRSRNSKAAVPMQLWPTME